MFTIGLKRPIDEDDIYAVTRSMASARNTDAFKKLWDLELKQAKPSVFRVMFKLHGYKILPLGILYAIGDTFAR